MAITLDKLTFRENVRFSFFPFYFVLRFFFFLLLLLIFGVYIFVLSFFDVTTS